MHQTLHVHGGTGKTTKDFHADVPFITQPPILDETKKKIGGKEYYEGWGGKLYEVTAFDRMFKVKKNASAVCLNRHKDDWNIVTLNQF